MRTDTVKVRVERFDPDERRSYFQEYDVPRGTRTRVLDFLFYIFEEVDPTLGYRRHLCRAKICNGCLMMVNGRARFVCWELVPPEQSEITLSPLRGRKVLKDLVTEFDGGDEPAEVKEEKR